MEQLAEEVKEIKDMVNNNAVNIADIQETISEIGPHYQKMNELIELIEQVKSALIIFVKIGNGVKWTIGLVAPIVGAYYAFKTGMHK